MAEITRDGVRVFGRDGRPVARPEMAVVQGDAPARMTRRAIEELGGMRRFISRGDVVVVKPNAACNSFS